MSTTLTDHATLSEALAAIRAELPAFQRTADNPFYSSKYVPLDALIGIVPIALAHGVILNGDSEPTGTGWCYVLTATHIQSAKDRVCRVPLVGLTDMQKTLAALTYAQRGAYGIMFQLQIGDDTDGNEAAGKSVRTLPEGQSGRPHPPRRDAANPTPSGTSRPPGSCPRCGVVGSIIQGRPEYGGGWLCYKKKNGCGAKFEVDPRVASSNVDNPTGEPEYDPDDPFRGL